MAKILTWLEPVSWDSASVISGETPSYTGLNGCSQLHFDPSLGFTPSTTGEGGTTQADAPSAYTTDVKVSQTSQYNELATPQLKAATVTLPAGVSISPSAAQGLASCQETGPEGIKIGSSSIGPLGQDLGDPEATELGADHEGGNGSFYDDGVYHVAKGHCPDASTIGAAEAFTPLLADGPNESEPLQGHIYLAAPKCGGAGQAPCAEASASNGELFGVYLELAGSGVIVRIPGTVAADPQAGRLTATFKEAPQLPFNDLKLHFRGGPRAPLANPQSCGQATTSSVLEPWSAPATPSATVSSSFNVDWDGHGGACPGAPFNPAFTAGTVTAGAGAFSPFTLTFSRQDREQDLTGLSETFPRGLLAQLAQIGTVQAEVGAGSQPFHTPGKIYLTGSYNGGGFGESVAIPAVAGPFNLGTVVVRGSIRIDPATAQVSVVSNPFPQSVDGVPLRIRTINVTLDRPSVSSPFAVSGCANLPFRPSFTASTQGKATFAGNGASLDVRVGSRSGPGVKAGEEEANIAKVDVQLPKALPARLSTLQKACTEAQFAANPAGCPAASDVGTATANTPVLPVPLTGPAYLVSHGGAAFPDLVVVLQGDGVTIDFVGNTQIKGSITYSRFETVPDSPVSSFELNLPEGPHSALAKKSKGEGKARKHKGQRQGVTREDREQLDVPAWRARRRAPVPGPVAAAGRAVEQRETGAGRPLRSGRGRGGE